MNKNNKDGKEREKEFLHSVIGDFGSKVCDHQTNDDKFWSSFILFRYPRDESLLLEDDIVDRDDIFFFLSQSSKVPRGSSVYSRSANQP